MNKSEHSFEFRKSIVRMMRLVIGVITGFRSQQQQQQQQQQQDASTEYIQLDRQSISVVVIHSISHIKQNV
jgi:hypothetical protein